jgi:hypothetical protein
MTDSPRTVSRARKFAREVVPVRIRSAFVHTVDAHAWRKRKPGRHHARVCSDPPAASCSDAECPVHGEPEWDSEDSNTYVADQEAAEAAAWRESRP